MNHRTQILLTAATLALVVGTACGVGGAGEQAASESEADAEAIALSEQEITLFNQLRTFLFQNPCDTTYSQPFNEVHDCQRLVDNDGSQRVFGPLVGLLPNMTVLAGGTAQFANAQIVAYAVNYGVRGGVAPSKTYTTAGYDPLNILDAGTWSQPFIHCLWLKRQGSDWKAAMSPECDRPDTLNWDDLDVVRQGARRASAADYPITARWQWTNDNHEQLNGEQYIGLRCGAGWCAIGSTSLEFAPPDSFPVGGGPLKRTIPGWFDAQFLAVELAPGGPLVPGPWGEIMLHPSAANTINANWGPIASLQLEKGLGSTGEPAFYADKFNLNGNSNGATIFMRTNTGGSFDAEYRSTNRNDKPAGVKEARSLHSVKGAVRWKWNPQDETSWVPCGNSCCDIQWS